MTWAVQRFLSSRSKKYRMSSLCRSSNRHDDRNDNDDNNDNQSTAECSETGNTSISNNITPLRRLSRDNLNQHMRKTNSNHGGDDDNSSISSFNSYSLLSVDHLREHYSSRHDPLKVKDNEIKSLRALLQRERNEKDSLRALLLKERAEKDYLIQLYEDRQLATKTMSSRREIIWELNFVDYKVTFKSSPFSFLDKIWHLHFIRSDDAHFGFYLELSTCYQSDRNAVIYLMALFKLHHAFYEPLVKTKPEPLKFFEGEKRGLMNFISYDNLLCSLNQENILKLSVVLELAN